MRVCDDRSVHSVVGRESPTDRETHQVTEASSDALYGIYDGLSALSQMTILDTIMPSTRKNIDDDNETIYIPERTAQHIYSKESNSLLQRQHPYTGMMRW